jgi:hypothetical protein
MARDWVENGVSHGQILKWEKPYRVVPHMKDRDECFTNQQKFDVMTSFGDIITQKLNFYNFFVFHPRNIIIRV